VDEPLLKPGDRIHHYVVERVVAVGGQAVVYEARDPALGRNVAIKILRKETGETGLKNLSWRSLDREGRRSVRLDHPAFVTIFEVFQHEGTPALAMEYIEGCTLAERFAQGRMTLPEIRNLFGRIAHALAAAHRADLVHGDLTPANIMIRDNGTIVILDPMPRFRPGETASGTPSYTAPELTRGRTRTPAADVFSFGVLLAEALEHCRPGFFQRPALFRFQRLASACRREKPSNRPPDGAALEKALGLRSKTRRRPRPFALGPVGVLGLCAVTVGLFIYCLHGSLENTGNWSGMHRLAVEGTHPVLLPDGSSLIYLSGNNRRINIVSLVSGTSRIIRNGDRPIIDLHVFPDGQRLLFIEESPKNDPLLWEISIDGGLPRRLVPASIASISPDGRFIGIIQSSGGDNHVVILLDREGASPRTIHTFLGSPVPISLVFGPSGKSLIVVLTDGLKLSRLLRISLAEGKLEIITEMLGVPSSGIAVDAGSNEIIWPVRTEPEGETNLFVTSLKTGKSKIVYPGPGRSFCPSLDSTGKTLAFQISELDREIAEIAVNPEEGAPVSALTIIPGTRGASQPRISPTDPDYMAFCTARDRLELLDLRTGKAGSLFSTGISQYNPSWSPDGKLIACACLNDGHSDLWLVPIDGGTPERLTHNEGNNFQPNWYPDGKHLLFISNRDGMEDLYLLDLRNSSVKRLGHDGAANPAVSPNGRLVAYIVGVSGRRPHLRLASLDSTLDQLDTLWERPIMINAWAGGKPRFSPDGKWLALDQPGSQGGGGDIWAIPVDGNKTSRMIRLTNFPFPADLKGWFDWGPNWNIVATLSRKTDRICILHRLEDPSERK